MSSAAETAEVDAEALGYEAAPSANVSGIQAVRSYRDVLGTGRLSATIALEILDALAIARDGQAVFCLPRWGAGRLDVATVTDRGRVFAAVPERDTPDAWQVRQDGREEWVPKQNTYAFERADGARLPVVERAEAFAEVVR